MRDGNHADENGFDDKSTFRLEIMQAVPVNIWSIAPRSNSFSWIPGNFAGFYYDIDDDLGNETLFLNLTNGNRLSGDTPYGLVYTTAVGNKKFKFKEWGDYKAIGFFGKEYFAGYNPGKTESSNSFSNESRENNSLLKRQIDAILMDDNVSRSITSSDPLRLREGYELAIKSVDIDGNKVYLELSKDGEVVGSGIVIPKYNEIVGPIHPIFVNESETFSFSKSIDYAKKTKSIEILQNIDSAKKNKVDRSSSQELIARR